MQETNEQAITQEIKDFINSYCLNENIDFDKVRMKDVLVENNDGILSVDVIVGFPANLIGSGGKIAADLSKRLSKYLDRHINLKVRM